MNYSGRNGEYFEVIDINQQNCEILTNSQENELSLLWFTADNNQLKIDSIQHTFNTNEIICITEFHKLEIDEIKGLKLLKFNKPFYCILDHDSEVGCKGILYYGASDLPIIQIPENSIETLETVWKMLCLELESSDSLQLEMLQMMLKRTLILFTRIYKNQFNFELLATKNIDIVREFNFLVEKHFKEIHSVVEYAGLLNKAPKTLSNLFRKLGNKSPIQFIQGRLLLEAHRLLKYSDKSVSDISYELGFNDIQSFSRFFKRQEGVSPNDYRLSE
ncbi:MAG: AraC-like DNA-binding protein [Flammeovirgaceae bacterium]|jgi:AraC-like DNA-binding protein